MHIFCVGDIDMNRDFNDAFAALTELLHIESTEGIDMQPQRSSS